MFYLHLLKIHPQVKSKISNKFQKCFASYQDELQNK
jgi:hypothetical protein